MPRCDSVLWIGYRPSETGFTLIAIPADRGVPSPRWDPSSLGLVLTGREVGIYPLDAGESLTVRGATKQPGIMLASD